METHIFYDNLLTGLASQCGFKASVTRIKDRYFFHCSRVVFSNGYTFESGDSLRELISAMKNEVQAEIIITQAQVDYACEGVSFATISGYVKP